ncbi:3'-5' exonuclease [Fulvivirga sp. RKSG066]|uniref:3'-5' exonuclease n=1 Tax=Fulvivirga aurantia TaxID=2529383 RepID=UPI0012BD25E7|nr:3'-5' exonuclease [Fulvivirga aurantia]MTI20154.1 3'-5' exonuclease [Fulvivirga aurantia]
MATLKNILFLDVETVSAHDTFDQLDERLKAQWARKASFLKREPETTDEELYFKRGGIYAEFGKIVVISLGYFVQVDGKTTFRVTSLADHDEKALLERFKAILEKLDDDLKLCAHNGREFDFPYLSRRMLINGIKLPSALDLAGKKPWEVNHLDTMDMWKFGDWKHYTSLELMAALFGIESSKSTIDGSMVNEVYHKDNDLQRIADYCKDDVIVTAQLYCKLKSIDVEFEVINVS